MTIRTVTTADHREQLIADGIDRLLVLDRFGLTGVVTVDGIKRVRDWTVTTNPDLPYGRLLVEPLRLTLAVREEGDLVLLLAAANARAQARRYLRAKVLETVHALGLPSFRAFAYPAGVAR